MENKCSSTLLADRDCGKSDVLFDSHITKVNWENGGHLI
jgi:hypothetical protein